MALYRGAQRILLARRMAPPALALVVLLMLAGCGGRIGVTTAPTATGCPADSFSAIYQQLPANIPQGVSFDITSNIETNVNGVAVTYKQHGQGTFNAAAPEFRMMLSTGDSHRLDIIETTHSSGTKVTLTGPTSADVGLGAFKSGVGIDLSDPFNYKNFSPVSVSCASVRAGGLEIQVWDLHGSVAPTLAIDGVGPSGHATEDLYVSTGNTNGPSAPAKYFPVQMVISVDGDSNNQFVSLLYNRWSRQLASYATSATSARPVTLAQSRTAVAPSIVRHWTVTPASYGTEVTVTSGSGDATPTPGQAATSGSSTAPCASVCSAVPLSLINPAAGLDTEGDDPVVNALVDEVGPLMDELDTCGKQASYLSIWGWYPDIKWVNSAC